MDDRTIIAVTLLTELIKTHLDDDAIDTAFTLADKVLAHKSTTKHNTPNTNHTTFGTTPIKSDMRLTELNLDARHESALHQNKIYLVADLITKSSKDILQLHNIGKTGLHHIEGKLKEYGLHLGTQLVD